MSLVLGADAGTVTVTDAALAQIVLQAAEAVDGARVRRAKRHLEISVADGRARVELELAVAYGQVLPDIARDVQQQVADALTGMCGVEIDAIDVSVEELDT
jgi:uncharacterized alkaline shock family protein YloU